MTSLKELNGQISSCRACRLASGRTNAVPGEGSQNAALMFIGEAPGEYEDKLARPFVGAAGKFLDELLASIGLNRPDVYITNIAKCRPPGNRDPLPDEILACKHWLDSQIQAIGPKVIITLGRFSMSLFLPGKAIGKCHGSPVRMNGITYFPMYHPAAALHQQSLREVIKSDMQKIPALISGTEQVPDQGHQEPPARQMTLF
jgi:DNA polymerase